MARSLHPLVNILLEQKYRQNFLIEKLDDTVDFLPKSKQKAPSDIRKRLGSGLMDVSDVSGYTDFAAKNMPFVGRMAQAEVPLAKTNKKEYEELRTELAKAVVQERKKAFDSKEKVDEKQILKNIVANNPEFAHVLTREEYEDLAGDITNPLVLDIEKEDESGKKTKETAVNFDKWTGIDNNAAMVYDFLVGANESLTTPEGLAMAAAGGAAFKAGGAALKAGLRGTSKAFSKAAQIAAGKMGGKVAKSATAAAKVTGKASDYAETAVNAAGAAALLYGGYGAWKEGELAKYTGNVAGGYAPFMAGYQAAPYMYRPVVAGTKATGRFAYETGKAAAKKGADVAGEVKSALEAGAEYRQAAREAKARESGGVKIYRTTGEPIQTPQEVVSAYKKGEGTWTPGQELPPKIPSTYVPSTSPTPRSKIKDIIGATILSTTIASGGGPRGEIYIPTARVEPAISRAIPETSPGLRNISPESRPQVSQRSQSSIEASRPSELTKAGKAPEAGKAPKAPEAGKETKAPEAGKAPKAPEAGKETKVSTGKETKAPEAGKETKVPEAGKAPGAPGAPEANKAPEGARATNKDVVGNDGGGGGDKRGRGRDEIPGKTRVPPKIPPFIPIGGGGNQKSSSVGFEKLRGAMVNNDINTMLRNLYSVSQTITIA